jgi:hypothetical protein
MVLNITQQLSPIVYNYLQCVLSSYAARAFSYLTATPYLIVHAVGISMLNSWKIGHDVMEASVLPPFSGEDTE